jgi:phosphoglycolate phosphatase
MDKYKIIIFDLDGTLSDSVEGITKSVQYALEKIGITEENTDALRHFVGPPLKEEFIKSYSLTEETADEAVRLYRERYVPIGIYETNLYYKADELLEKLKNEGRILAIATSKPQLMAEKVLEYLNIDKYFDYIMGADLIGNKQSKQDVLNALFESINIYDKSEMILIGDTVYDVIGANHVGINCLAVSYGYGDADKMVKLGAIGIAENVSQIIEYI